jgi:hypothetical protein
MLQKMTKCASALCSSMATACSPERLAVLEVRLPLVAVSRMASRFALGARLEASAAAGLSC